MRVFRTQMWSYAVLLIILFAIASRAVRTMIVFLEEQNIPEVHIISAQLWSLSLGFMFIAGAFGLWAIKFSAEAESRRRIGLLVDAMDYITDGLIAVDERGHIAGSNPAAHTITGRFLADNELLRNAFPLLTEADVAALLVRTESNEVEHEVPIGPTTRMLRFRSQPSEGLNLILISDVTASNSRRLRARQTARLELIGQIARGVANDFNNLLWTISGHASLLTRLKPGSEDMNASIHAIAQSSERGIALASHLLQLGKGRASGKATHMVEEHIRNAEQLLRDTLPYGWSIECSIADTLPPVELTGLEIEQAVINIGLMASDCLGTPGILRITAARPGSASMSDVPARFAGVIQIQAIPPGSANTPGTVTQPAVQREAGVIFSVIKSMLEETGGALQELVATNGSPVYRMSLPHGTLSLQKEKTDRPTDELRTYMANWNVLLALPRSVRYDDLASSLTANGIRFERTELLTTTLGRIEDSPQLDVIVIDRNLLGSEARALLRAIIKICPGAGVLVLCEDIESESEGMSGDLVFAEPMTDTPGLLSRMVDARNLTVNRHKP